MQLPLNNPATSPVENTLMAESAIDLQAQAVAPAQEPVILSRSASLLLLLRMRCRILMLALLHIPNPFKALWALRQLNKTRRKFFGDFKFQKVIKLGKRYFYELNTSGWPSPAFDQYILSELNRIVPFQNEPHYLKVLLLAITKKCALQCAHCFEWNALNGKEKLSVENLKEIIQKFQANGVGQIQFSGGEPLLRMPVLLELLQSSAPATDFWVITSGHRLTTENALALARAGLTGVSISLDHIDPHEHNKFRGFQEAYHWVKEAAANARAAGLVVSLSLCATRDFVTEDNLLQYARLAQKLGAAFVQVLEPKAVGHFANQEVSLTPEQVKLLINFYEKVNYEPAYQQLPIVVYHEYHRRRVGCVGAADRYLYIDTDGDMHACPFCQKKSGCATDANLNDLLQSLKQQGCPAST